MILFIENASLECTTQQVYDTFNSLADNCVTVIEERNEDTHKTFRIYIDLYRPFQPFWKIGDKIRETGKYGEWNVNVEQYIGI
jgi:hypothetical protein